MCDRKSYLISPVPDLGSHEGTSRPHPFHQNVVSLQPFRFQLLDVIGHKVVGFCELSDPKKQIQSRLNHEHFKSNHANLDPSHTAVFLNFGLALHVAQEHFAHM